MHALVSLPTRVVRVMIPGLRLVNPTNVREIWQKRSRRAKHHRTLVAYFLNGQRPVALPVVVTITRCGLGLLDAHDSLPASAKHVADQVAQWLGIDDSDARITWRYAQRRERDWSCEIEIRSVEAA